MASLYESSERFQRRGLPAHFVSKYKTAASAGDRQNCIIFLHPMTSNLT